MKYWYYSYLDEQDHGPFERDVIVTLIQTSVIKKDDLIWLEEKNEYISISEFNDLISH